MTDSIFDLVGIEFPARERKKKIDTLFSSMDLNKDGMVTMEEYLTFCNQSETVIHNINNLA